MKRFILSFVFLYIGLVVTAGNQVEIFTPRIPVVTGREYGIVTEICIESDGRADTLDRIDLAVTDLDPALLRSARLVYTGTLSAIRSRTTSYVLTDQGKRLGGGQTLYADKGFGIVQNILHPTEPVFGFPVGKALVKGRNYFHISLEITPRTIEELARPFTLEVERVVVNGSECTLDRQGAVGSRLGVSVRQHGDDGVWAYRIPGLVTTNSGTLLGVYDVRHVSSLDLQNDIDVGVSRSTDGGVSWEPMRIALDMGEWGGLPEAQNGVGDPAVLVDTQTGEIFILAVWTHGCGGDRAWTAVGDGLAPEETAQLMLTSSRDDGRSWSEPRNITRQIKHPEWFLTLQGPGRGICMKDGTLVYPIQFIGADRIPCAGIIYSKDHGQTWHFHTPARSNTTESQVAELPDGSLMLNMRDNRKTGRAVSVTRDLGRTWQEHPSSGGLIEPVCMASLLNIPAERNVLGRDLLLFSNPATTKGRHSMTIRVSLDGGYTWLPEHSLLLDAEENWGYSCLTQIDAGHIGILYESSVSQMLFQAVRLTDLVRKESTERIRFEAMPEIPATAEGYADGVSAACCGVAGGRLIVAGGANFPGNPLAADAKKRFYNDIWMLDPSAATPTWRQVGTLPAEMAYAASYVCGDRMIVAGGAGPDGCSDRVYALTVKRNRVMVSSLPSLPFPVEQAAAAQVGNRLFLAGGLTTDGANGKLLVCDLDAGARWRVLADLPEHMVQPLAAASHDAIYLWSGFDPDTKRCSEKGYRLDLATGSWRTTAPVPEGATLTGSTLLGADASGILVSGGVDRKRFETGLAASTAEEQAAYLAMPPAHYAFSNRIRYFRFADETWQELGCSGRCALAGAAAATDRDRGVYYLVGGEIKPRVRSPKIWKIEVYGIPEKTK